MAFRFTCPLYPIVGERGTGSEPLDVAEAILGCGVPLIQLRLKDTATGRFVDLAREMRKRCDQHRALLIVNDRCDIAKLVGADGVHLGQDDLAPAAAREILGPDAVIGHSTHDAAQLERAIADPAVDYVAYGPIFGTSSKRNPDPVRGLDRLRAAAALCPRPLVAIGGIDETTIAEALGAGADTVAVISAITGAAAPEAATRRLLGAARSADG
jgi:thiamine-phosphate pyrophosphorylase